MDNLRERAHALAENQGQCFYQVGHSNPHSGRCDAILAALQAVRGETWREAAGVCEAMVVGGRAWTHEQSVASDALFAASENMKAKAGE